MQWRSVFNYEGLYMVSSMGDVKRLDAVTKGFLRIALSGSRKCPQVALYRNGKKTTLYVSRIVAASFLGAPPTHMHQVNHKDGNVQNNNIDNLEWVTPSENMKHSYDVLDRYRNIPRPAKAIVGTSLIDGSTISFSSVTDVESYGFSKGNVSLACQKKRPNAHGYTWEYLNV